MLTRYKAEVQKAAKASGAAGQQMAQGIQAAQTQIQSLLSSTEKLNKDGSLTETRKGYDELGRSITEVYKAGQLLNRTVATESTLTQDIRRANELYKEQAASLKKLYELKIARLSVSDNTAASHEIDQQIADTQRLIDLNRNVISQLDQEAVSRSKLVNLAHEEAAAVQKYNKALALRQDKNAAANAQPAAGVTELKQLEAAYKQLTNAYRQYNMAVKNGNETGQAYWSQNAQQA